MDIEVKGLRSLQGRDGDMFTATLWLDGKKAGEVSNDGNGGCNFYHFVTPAIRDAFYAHIMQMPPYPVEDDAPDWVRELYPNGEKSEHESSQADLVVEKIIEQQQKDKQRKTAVLFKVKGKTPYAEYMRISTKNHTREQVLAHLRGKYGERLVVV